MSDAWAGSLVGKAVVAADVRDRARGFVAAKTSVGLPSSKGLY